MFSTSQVFPMNPPELLFAFDVDLQGVEVDGEESDDGVDHLDPREDGEDLPPGLGAPLRRVQGADEAHPDEAREDGADLLRRELR